jgi:SAM-dependent methyltransferase
MMEIWSPEEEFDLERAGGAASKFVLVASAQKAGIFEALLEEKDIPMLQREFPFDERALYIVLEALCALGYVEKNRGRYVLSEMARALFVEGGEKYVGGFLPHFLDIMKAWMALPEIIKGAKPEKETGKRDVAAFMNAMASKPDDVVAESVERCIARKSDIECVLDLGGGPGKYSKAFANMGLKVVLYDLPDVIDYVSTAFGLKDLQNLTLKKGDFMRDDLQREFGEGSFDMVFLGNICHIYSEKENQKLIKRVGMLLKHNGMIAIEDFVRGRSPVAELFAVNMLANTESGNTYTEAQYRSWLEDAGFHSIEVFDLSRGNSQLITGFVKNRLC